MLVRPASGKKVLWQEMPHVFQAISCLPESRHAERHIVDFIRAHTGWDQGAAVQALLASASGHG